MACITPDHIPANSALLLLDTLATASNVAAKTSSGSGNRHNETLLKKVNQA